jgi:hypothetical protein
MRTLSRLTKDRIFTVILLIVFGVLSIATLVAARSAQVASKHSQEAIERSAKNGSVLDFIKDCTNPGGACYKHNQDITAVAVNLVTAQTACIVKESLGYNLPDRTPTEIEEIKGICHQILNGDALDLLRRVHAFIVENSTTTTTTTTTSTTSPPSTPNTPNTHPLY